MTRVTASLLVLLACLIGNNSLPAQAPVYGPVQGPTQIHLYNGFGRGSTVYGDAVKADASMVLARGLYYELYSRGLQRNVETAFRLQDLHVQKTAYLKAQQQQRLLEAQVKQRATQLRVMRDAPLSNNIRTGATLNFLLTETQSSLTPRSDDAEMYEVTPQTRHGLTAQIWETIVREQDSGVKWPSVVAREEFREIATQINSDFAKAVAQTKLGKMIDKGQYRQLRSNLQGFWKIARTTFGDQSKELSSLREFFAMINTVADSFDSGEATLYQRGLLNPIKLPESKLLSYLLANDLRFGKAEPAQYDDYSRLHRRMAERHRRVTDAELIAKDFNAVPISSSK